MIDLAVSAHLRAIEWGGDVHVPEGALQAAAEIGRKCRDAGLAVAGYGSYFRLGEGREFSATLKTARALGAHVIRIWAGTQPSAALGRGERERFADELRSVADQAAAEGGVVSLEHHENTLCDSVASTRALVKHAGHSSVALHWQRLDFAEEDQHRQSLTALIAHVRCLHVFFRVNSGVRPLREGIDAWTEPLRIAAGHAVPWALIEFVRENRPDQLFADAATLTQMIDQARGAIPPADRARSGSSG